MSDDHVSGHPRTRGARSLFEHESSFGGEIPLEFGTVKGFDGTPIFYCSEGQGEPLVFCYGIACSSLHWTYQIDYFRKNYRCIWVDYRGHRHTPLPANLNTLTIDACVRDLKSVLDFLEIPQATFLGHSMGVNVVLEFAKQHPQVVQSLVLACGTAKRPLDTLLGGSYLLPAFEALSWLQKERPSWVQSFWKFQNMAFPIVREILGTLGFNTAYCHPQDIETYTRQIISLPPAVLTRMMEDYQDLDATPWLHEIQQNTLIISGDEDKITPPDTQALMAQLMPNAELASVHRGSHCVTLDQPDLVNLMIEKFLKR